MNRRQFLAAIGVVSQRKFLLEGIDPVVCVRYPYLQNVRHDRAAVMWATSAPGTGWVDYSTDNLSPWRRAFAASRTFFPQETFMPAPFTQYTAFLPRLFPNTSYTYNVVVDGEPVTTSSRLRTAGAGPFRFLVVGDSGMGTLEQARVASRLMQEEASFLIHVGDIAYGHGNFPEFQRNYFDYYAGLMQRMPLFTSPGNHEYDKQHGGAPYFALHNFPTETVPSSERGRYYSFDWGNVHFVSLDSTSSHPDGTRIGTLGRVIDGTSDMLNWLQRDLRSTRQFWKVVFFHHPPYAGGQNYGDMNEREAEKYLPPILEANGVQLVLNGHEHNYQRTYGLKGGRPVSKDGTGTLYLTSGGGGAQLYTPTQLPQTAYSNKISHYVRAEVSGTRMVLRAINDSGIEFDTFTLAPQPVLADINRPIVVDRSSGEQLIKIKGWNLAAQEAFAISNSLAGTSLTVDGSPMPVIYVSPTQIVGKYNFPFPLTGSHRFVITTVNGILDVSALV